MLNESRLYKFLCWLSDIIDWTQTAITIAKYKTYSIDRVTSTTSYLRRIK